MSSRLSYEDRGCPWERLSRRPGPGTSQDATIEVVDVVKRYGALTAVDGVSLSVGQGEFFGILGPNGAGKTTLLEMIEGLRQAGFRNVTVLGESVWPRNPTLLPRIGVQLQASSFFERLTAREQLDTFGSLYGAPAPGSTRCSTWSD